MNLTGNPAPTVPAGFTDDGLPIGLQIIGRHLDDPTVLRAAAAFEAAGPVGRPLAGAAQRHGPVAPRRHTVRLSRAKVLALTGALPRAPDTVIALLRSTRLQSPVVRGRHAVERSVEVDAGDIDDAFGAEVDV
jgi:hypothetical protein